MVGAQQGSFEQGKEQFGLQEETHAGGRNLKFVFTVGGRSAPRRNWGKTFGSELTVGHEPSLALVFERQVAAEKRRSWGWASARSRISRAKADHRVNAGEGECLYRMPRAGLVQGEIFSALRKDCRKCPASDQLSYGFDFRGQSTVCGQLRRLTAHQIIGVFGKSSGFQRG